jgi:hypothetical protein
VGNGEAGVVLQKAFHPKKEPLNHRSIPPGRENLGRRLVEEDYLGPRSNMNPDLHLVPSHKARAKGQKLQHQAFPIGKGP